MIELVAVYYSAATDAKYCVYERVRGEYSARILVDGAWELIKKNGKRAVELAPCYLVDQNLKEWLRNNDPAAMKLNYVENTIPHGQKVSTPLRPTNRTGQC